ncbi:methylenetetrahydrofolate reductase C-terminal domain-containing protein [Azospirillum sp. TSO22-1]|uniref:methylenetetrahydrofolate reductase C-terminal domain-containing protein n=1 Tax=Azospirillum sp. TSO22-1 TaxID=716789 RepID=UPI000D64441D|nr:methylenetetrahydrofolate reductase C-terminal domain-containing protein [Azospirillum sp. TSO22-1]
MEAVRHWSVRHARGLKRVYDACARWAPLLGGAVRRLGPPRAERLLLPAERAAKRFLFDCRMCGQCALSHTGMACPTNCAKGMRNGPCGGVRADGGCEVDPAMRCVWVEATAGRKRVDGRPDGPALAPLDHRRTGRSTLVPLMTGRPVPATAAAETPPPRERTVHGFEQACRSGRFVVTAEVAPPDSADPAALVERAARFRGLVDALNITDGAGGNCHMSSVAAAAVLAAHGFDPVAQIACRDRNRIAVQGDILGAAALGVRNVLCLTGDHGAGGDQPEAKPVFDLDAVSLLRVARDMRDRGVFASGRALETPPNLFLGATANPFVPPFADRAANLERKVEAGARFIQTQFCFDLHAFADFLRAVRERELHRRCALIVGVGTLGSAKALRWMAERVPGVHVPAPVIERVARVADQKAEGKRILVETIRALAEMEGVAGVHLMGHRNESVLADAIVESGLRTAQTAA